MHGHRDWFNTANDYLAALQAHVCQQQQQLKPGMLIMFMHKLKGVKTTTLAEVLLAAMMTMTACCAMSNMQPQKVAATLAQSDRYRRHVAYLRLCVVHMHGVMK